MGNRSARQRMQHDTTMRSDLPPRCLVIATGERLPEGLSTNARTFLVTVPKLSDADKQPWADKLSHAQADRDQLPLAMAAYLQWIAVHWETLEKDVPARFHALRTAAYQDGSHTREPGQVAYLQLAWEMFTRCAVDAGVLSTDFQQAILDETQAYLSGLAGEHSQILHDDTTVSRFLALLGDGFASKQIYLRTPRDTAPMDAGDWGWTEEEEYDRKTDSKALVPRAHQATLVGYLDGEYIYLLPDAIYRYLQHASQKAGRTWPVDSTTFQRELDDAGLILTVVDKKRTYRQKNKKVNGKAIRCVWVNREALRLMMGEATEREPGEEDERIPF
jgi:hypothetical protein